MALLTNINFTLRYKSFGIEKTEYKLCIFTVISLSLFRVRINREFAGIRMVVDVVSDVLSVL